jgi:hypothetical protein
MYAVVLIVCLASLQGQCVEVVEDPVVYFHTQEECETALVKVAEKLITILEERKEQGQIGGVCVDVPGIKGT